MEWKFVKVQCAWCTSDREAWVYCRADGTFEPKVHGETVPTKGPLVTLQSAKEAAEKALAAKTKG